jgi:hypothetical protein
VTHSRDGEPPGALWYDGESQLAIGALERLKCNYSDCFDLGGRPMPDSSALARALGSVTVAVTTIRATWFALRLLRHMTEGLGPHVLWIVTLNPDKLLATLQKAPESSAIAALVSSGRLDFSDISKYE